jgi:hypothetical protein
VTPSACTVVTGFPIRRSQDQSLFDSSPGHIAACHVLHRLITPRHPPCTLSSLITIIIGPGPSEGGNRPVTIFKPHRRSSPRSRADPRERLGKPHSNASPMHFSKSRLKLGPGPIGRNAAIRPASARRRGSGFIPYSAPPGKALSTKPSPNPGRPAHPARPTGGGRMETTGFEPATFWLQTRRSPS